MALNVKWLALFGGIIPLIAAGLDQASKLWALNFFGSRYGIPKEICADPEFRGFNHAVSQIFDLTLACNRGVSYGLLGGESELKRWLLAGFAILVSLVLVYMITKVKDRLTALSLAFIIGGSIGNVIDRIRFGAVVDFLDFGGLGFPYIFNVADSFITAGVIGMLLAAFFVKDAPDTPRKAA